MNGGEMINEYIDILDTTPLRDIKSYIPAIDCFPDETVGWIIDYKDAIEVTTSDRRFC